MTSTSDDPSENKAVPEGHAGSDPQPADEVDDTLPIGLIAQTFRTGNVVPFLGAGASASQRPADASWAEGVDFLPYGGELAEHLARAVAYPDKDSSGNLQLVATYFEHVHGDREILHQYLRRIFLSRGRPGCIHRVLAGVEQPLLIITTNYDDLIERAFGDRPFVLIVDPGDGKRIWVRRSDGSFAPVLMHDARKLPELRSDLPVVYKLHGTVNPESEHGDSFLITEQDYVSFLGRATSFMPPCFMERMTDASLLFLGYSLADLNIRALVRSLRQRFVNQKKYPFWAVTRGMSTPQKEIWRVKGVEIYNADLHRFAWKLANELRIALDPSDHQ